MSNSETGYWYKVSQRSSWQEKEFDERFPGSRDQLFLLTDADVVELIIKFGRAAIESPEGADHRVLEFQNDYD